MIRYPNYLRREKDEDVVELGAKGVAQSNT